LIDLLLSDNKGRSEEQVVSFDPVRSPSAGISNQSLFKSQVGNPGIEPQLGIVWFLGLLIFDQFDARKEAFSSDVPDKVMVV
jgi:hypothetical protein